jgi:hypothetical protein
MNFKAYRRDRVRCASRERIATVQSRPLQPPRKSNASSPSGGVEDRPAASLAPSSSSWPRRRKPRLRKSSVEDATDTRDPSATRAVKILVRIRVLPDGLLILVPLPDRIVLRPRPASALLRPRRFGCRSVMRARRHLGAGSPRHRAWIFSGRRPAGYRLCIAEHTVCANLIDGCSLCAIGRACSNEFVEYATLAEFMGSLLRMSLPAASDTSSSSPSPAWPDDRWWPSTIRSVTRREQKRRPGVDQSRRSKRPSRRRPKPSDPPHAGDAKSPSGKPETSKSPV